MASVLDAMRWVATGPHSLPLASTANPHDSCQHNLRHSMLGNTQLNICNVPNTQLQCQRATAATAQESGSSRYDLKGPCAHLHNTCTANQCT